MELLHCSPAAVNKNFHFSWEPWWWWQNKGGWIASFSIDGDYLLCGVIETLQVWDLRSHRCVRILSTPREDYEEGVDIALNCLDLHDNIAVSGSNEGIIRVWNVTTKKFTKRLDCSHDGAVNSVKLVEYKEDQLFMLSGHDEGQLVVWRVHSPTNIGIRMLLNPYHNILWSIDISPKYVVTGSENCRIHVYKSEKIFEFEPTDEMVSKILKDHKEAVTCVNIKDEILVSGSRDKTIIIWKDETREEYVPKFTMIRIMRGHEDILHYVYQDDDRII